MYVEHYVGNGVLLIHDAGLTPNVLWGRANDNTTLVIHGCGGGYRDTDTEGRLVLSEEQERERAEHKDRERASEQRGRRK